ncbi:MAG: hypothetical protein M3N68_10735, partial [Actinomycetota bacterium]|nr:hypothetical protein [Actinomycetota bacterium]
RFRLAREVDELVSKHPTSALPGARTTTVFIARSKPESIKNVFIGGSGAGFTGEYEQMFKE